MVFGNFFKLKQQQNQYNEKQDIYEGKEIKIKGKRRKRTSASTTDIDTSGILAQPFPPMFSRAKSPSDILDFVGYPKPIPSPGLIHNISTNNNNNNNNNNNKDGISPMAYYQLPMAFNIPLTIRNKTPEISSSPSPSNSPHNNNNNNNKPLSNPTSLSSSIMVYSQNRATLSSPSLLQMPTPKKVIPPTRRILNADQNDKTLVLEDQSTAKKAISIDDVELLRQQMKEIQLERQDWIRLEKERRKVEEDLLRTIKENQDKIKELSLQQEQQIQQKQQQRQLNLLKYKASVNSLPLSTPPYTQDDEEESENDDDQTEDSFYYERPSFNETVPTFYYEANQCKQPFYHQPIYFDTEDIETSQHISSHHSESSSGYYSDEEEVEEVEEDEDNSYEEEAYYYPMLPSSSATFHPHWQQQRQRLSLPPPSTRYMDMNHFWPCPQGPLTNDILVSPSAIHRNTRGYSQVPPQSIMNPPQPPHWFHRPHSTRYMMQQYSKSLSSSPTLRKHHSLGDDQFNL
ncbi:unnamed protein product [Cunninghamella echinulata]